VPRLLRIIWPFVLAGVGFTLAHDHPAARLAWNAVALGFAAYGIYRLQRMQDSRRR
jgi:hypothetical protein